MKKSIMACMGLAALILLCGCPVSSTFPLQEKAKGSIDKDLAGTWTNTITDAEVTKVTITVDEDNTYKVEVIEKGEMYMAETSIFKGWLTELGERKFLVLQEVSNGVADETYYVYDIVIDGKEMTTHDIALKVKGTDAIISVEAYREEVKGSMSHSEFLSNEIKWKKAD